MPTTRRAIQSPLYQGSEERVAYKFDFGRWGTLNGTPEFKLYDMSTGKFDVSSTNLSGSAGVTGSLAYSPYVVLLTDGVTYRLEAEALISGNLMIGYLLIVGEE
jgi:hypothetical protein